MTRKEWTDLLARDRQAMHDLVFATGAKRDALLRSRRLNRRLIEIHGDKMPTEHPAS